MALVRCPECQREVSDSGKVCVHCGYILPKAKAKKESNTLKIVFIILQSIVVVMSYLPILFDIELMSGSDLTPIGYVGYSCWDSYGSGLFGNLLDAPEVMDFSPIQVLIRMVFVSIAVFSIIWVACATQKNRIMAKRASWLLPIITLVTQIVAAVITANESTFVSWHESQYEHMVVRGELFLWISLQIAATVICIIYNSQRKKTNI